MNIKQIIIKSETPPPKSSLWLHTKEGNLVLEEYHEQGWREISVPLSTIESIMSTMSSIAERVEDLDDNVTELSTSIGSLTPEDIEVIRTAGAVQAQVTQLSSKVGELEATLGGEYTLTSLNIGYIGVDGSQHDAKSQTRGVYSVSKSQIHSTLITIDAYTGGSGIAVVTYWNNGVFVKRDESVGNGTNGRVNKSFNVPTDITFTDIYISVNPSEEYSLSSKSTTEVNIERIDAELDDVKDDVDELKSHLSIAIASTPLNIGYISKTGEKTGSASSTRRVYSVSKESLRSGVTTLKLSAKVGGSAIAVVSYWNNSTFVSYDNTIAGPTSSGGSIDSADVNLPSNITYTDIYFSIDPSADFSIIAEGDTATKADIERIDDELVDIKADIEELKPASAVAYTPLNIGYINKTGGKVDSGSSTRRVYSVSKESIKSGVTTLKLSAKVGGSAIAVVSYWNNNTFVQYDSTIAGPSGSGGYIEDANVNLPTDITYTDIYFSLDPSSEFSIIAADNKEVAIENLQTSITNVNQRVLYLETFTKLPQIKNVPLPRKKTDEVCNILYLGSSWTQDNYALMYGLTQAAGLRVSVFNWYMGSATFENVLSNWDSSEIQMVGNSYGEADTVRVNNCSVKQALTYKQWDVIVIANSANNSASWTNYGNAATFVRKIKMVAPQATLATYYGWVLEGDVNTQSVWNTRLDVYKKFVMSSGIDVTIPTGMALWSMLSTSYGQDSGIMYRGDSTHLSYGFGRYIAACTNFLAIFTPMYGVGIAGNTYRGPSGYIITDQQAQDAQLFALSANANQYSFIDMSSEVD